MNLTLSLYRHNKLYKSMSHSNFAYLTLYKESYQSGDFIEVSGDLKGHYFIIQVDATMNPACVYATSNLWRFPIPFDEKEHLGMHPYAFCGNKHYISIRYATDFEIRRYQNLAANTHDQKDVTCFFPHASANVETRNEAVFYARNAIDGSFANDYHGKYPYQSWGINQQANAAWNLDFGRPVIIDCLALTLRADFPHDSYWTQATVSFNDGSQEILSLIKTADRQLFDIKPRTVTSLTFHELIKATDNSPFPALTQFEAFGYNKID